MLRQRQRQQLKGLPPRPKTHKSQDGGQQGKEVLCSSRILNRLPRASADLRDGSAQHQLRPDALFASSADVLDPGRRRIRCALSDPPPTAKGASANGILRRVEGEEQPAADGAHSSCRGSSPQSSSVVGGSQREEEGEEMEETAEQRTMEDHVMRGLGRDVAKEDLRDARGAHLRSLPHCADCSDGCRHQAGHRSTGVGEEAAVAPAAALEGEDVEGLRRRKKKKKPVEGGGTESEKEEEEKKGKEEEDEHERRIKCCCCNQREIDEDIYADECDKIMQSLCPTLFTIEIIVKILFVAYVYYTCKVCLLSDLPTPKE